MTAESASDRQLQWELVVRRSFGISDLVADNDARETLIGCFEDQLRANGWQSLTRGIAEPIVSALMVLGANGELDDYLPAELGLSVATFTSRDAAYRLLDHGMTVVDPEHLVFDMMSEFPPEVVATAQQVLYRIGQYARQQPFGD